MRHVGSCFVRPRHGVVRQPAFMIIYVGRVLSSGCRCPCAHWRRGGSSNSSIRSHVISEVYIQGWVIEAEAPPVRGVLICLRYIVMHRGICFPREVSVFAGATFYRIALDILLGEGFQEH